ncbi:MAG: OmpA family protein [Treponema sp.]|jgi:outer membrane protein OmpA-like peptidoglycan-associated protein|nr:OmpA family protein [Treponema sp.]
MKNILEDIGIGSLWIALILAAGVFAWGMTRSVHAESLQKAVNTVVGNLVEVGDTLSYPDSPQSNLGTWYAGTQPEEKVLVFSILYEGMSIPCVAQISEEGTRVIPVSSSTQETLKRIQPRVINDYVSRIEASVHKEASESESEMIIEYREPANPVNEQIAADITTELENLGITDTQVTIVDEGISINLEDIQFVSNSERMLAGEERKLDQIGTILRQYQNRNVLITGHTAQVGNTTAGDQELSESRARTVANYFIQNGIREASQIESRGYGSSRPVADNSTEAGRQKNRRVEIILR